ncbi:hypothetical protein J6590_000062 [Homalodisca vitripennis]|nr:hypothetical protein J6590_000062 [Homalodisca vitripennis]
MYVFVLVLVAMSSVAVAELDFLLLHTNDMHARFQQTDKYSGICGNMTSGLCYGGFARLHAEAVRRKQEAANKGLPKIFLNAGDSYQGTPFYTFYKWRIVAKFVNMLGMDVMGKKQYPTEALNLFDWKDDAPPP